MPRTIKTAPMRRAEAKKTATDVTPRELVEGERILLKGVIENRAFRKCHVFVTGEDFELRNVDIGPDCTFEFTKGAYVTLNVIAMIYRRNPMYVEQMFHKIRTTQVGTTTPRDPA